MNNLEFLSYQPTPTEKHMGVATIRVERKYIFRFKIAQNPKAEGFFSNAPSIKVDDQYYPAFQIDSSYEADEVKKFVLSNVKLALQKTTSFTPTPLTFDTPGANVQQASFFDQPPF